MIEKIQIVSGDFWESLEGMTYESVGRLFMALMAYANEKDPKVHLGENIPALTLYPVMKNHIERHEVYRVAMAENGKRGGAPKGNSNAKKQPKTTKNNLKQPKTTENNQKQAPNPNPNPYPNPNVGAEQDTCSPPISAEPEAEIMLPLVDGSEYPITPGMVLEWCEDYPAVDVRQELRKMRAWLLSNRTKRKTKRGIEAFCTRWLAREQDRSGTAYNTAPHSATAPSFLDLARMMEAEA